MASWKLNASRRLLRDLKEVLELPLPNVAALPVEDNIFFWHGNVRGAPDSVYTDVPFHFYLAFPEDYPVNPPEIGLYTRMPHPNIVRNRRHGGAEAWRLALWDCNPKDNGWSCAYTVHSILVQLQAFLVCEDMLWGSSQVRLEDAIRLAADLVLKDCPHRGSSPWPPLPTPEELTAAAARAAANKAVIAAPVLKSRKVGVVPPPSNPPVAAKASAKPHAEGGTAAEASGGSGPEKPSDLTWQVAEGKKCKKAKPQQAAGDSKMPLGGGILGGSNPFAALLMESAKEEAGTDTAVVGTLQAALVPPSQPASKTAAPVSKAAKKNAKRGAKRAAAQQKSAAEAASPPTCEAAPQLPDVASPQDVEPPAETPGEASQAGGSEGASGATEADEWQVQPAKAKEVEGAPPPKPMAELIRDVMAAAAAADKSCGPEVAAGPSWSSSELGLSAGQFTQLPPDVLATILGQLSRKDIAGVSGTCKALRAMCAEGEVWRSLLRRDFGGARLTASTSAGWRHAYLLQAHNIVGELRCYFSKASFEDEVLGFPLFLTTNPKTGAVDYIDLHPQLLSVASFKQGVRKTPGRDDLGGDIKAVIPAYITENHFQRALPALQKLLKVLVPEAVGIGGRAPAPAHWLDACAKMLNTAVILLVDHGTAASQKAIAAYCSIHRLMLALAEHFNLWEQAAARLDRFLKNPAARTKEACPNLGWLIVMLAVSPRHSWAQVAPAVLGEMLDRSVLWACKYNLALQFHFTGSEAVDEVLVSEVFDSMRIGRGLLAFHSAFLHFVAKPPGSSLERVMDQADLLYGWPSLAQVAKLQTAIRRVQDMSSWADFLQLIGLNIVGARTVHEHMTQELRKAWHGSLRKRYHRLGMDFSRVQAAGISKILLKGQTYSAPPNMKAMEIADVWRWSTPDTTFLDASVLIYGPEGLVGLVDYAHTWWRRPYWGCLPGGFIAFGVTHSGDLMEDNAGKHLARVSFPMLGPDVSELYVVISAWAGRSLADVKQPHVLVRDCATDMCLCEYHLEDRAEAELRDNTAVVMCRVFRERQGCWRVEALGDILRAGSADDYNPILQHVDRLRAARQAA